MNLSSLNQLLEAVRAGETSVEQAVEALRNLPYEDLGYARIDHHRVLRRGIPEVIFCQGKQPTQTGEIFRRLAQEGNTVLATRATPQHFEAVRALTPEAEWIPHARIVRLVRPQDSHTTSYVAVLAAGTSDIPVAEEAAITADTFGTRVERAYDVGVAGLHRLLSVRDLIENASALVVVAGMEGALPSVVAGLISKPVIAVPTSVGYGASFEGLAALLAMLNSCATGVAVVNIDNGFGAGYMAHLIARGPSK